MCLHFVKETPMAKKKTKVNKDQQAFGNAIRAGREAAKVGAKVGDSAGCPLHPDAKFQQFVVKSLICPDCLAARPTKTPPVK